MGVFSPSFLVGTMLAILAGMMGILRAFGAVFLSNGSSNGNGHSARDVDQPTEEHVRGTVLAIDDEQAVLDALRPLLRAEGYNVLTATSGPKGLDMLRYCQRDVRVVVLDYNMPRLNGSDTLTFLRKLSPHVKVLAVTGVDTNLLPESFRQGVDKILAKPFATSQLVDSLNELLGYDPRAALKQS